MNYFLNALSMLCAVLILAFGWEKKSFEISLAQLLIFKVLINTVEENLVHIENTGKATSVKLENVINLLNFFSYMSG